MDTPDTPAQATARKVYDEACRVLAEATADSIVAERRYKAALENFQHAHGAAKQAGVIK